MVMDLGLKSDLNMHRAHGGPFRVRIEARQRVVAAANFQKAGHRWDQRMSCHRAAGIVKLGVMGRQVYLIHKTRKACGSKEFDLPLFRFPLRGQTGAGGFPPRRKHVARQQKALASTDAAGSPTRGLPSPCGSPARTRYFSGPGQRGQCDEKN